MKLLATVKKITVAFITISTLSLSAFAQDNDNDDDLQPHAGIKGGLTFSNLVDQGDDVTDKNVKVGYNVGVFAKLPITSHFAIQPELFIISKGNKSTYDLGNGTLLNPGPGQGTLDFNLTYLELPILAVINFNKYLNVQGGVYGAYLLNANVKNTSNNENYNSYESLNADNFERFDLGLSAGIGVDLHPVTMGLRYDYSLRNLGKSGVEGQMTKDARNSALQLYVGLGF